MSSASRPSQPSPRLPPRLPPRFLLEPWVWLLLGACAASTGSVAPTPWRVVRADSERLAADVEWLADDAREGRRAGSAGERAAADWLARRLGQLGLEPAGDGGYLQALEVPLEPENRGRSWVERLPHGASESERAGIRIAEGVQPLPCAAGGEVRGRLEFRGYGGRGQLARWNDYAVGDCDGAIVLVIDGAPEATRRALEAAASESAPDAWSVNEKLRSARRRGAVGVIVAQHPQSAGEALQGFHEGATSTSSVPALRVSAAVAEQLLPGYSEHVRAFDEHLHATGERRVGGLASPGEVVISADVMRGFGTATNVLGIVPGIDRTRTIVIGAHFDHLGRGGSGSRASAWGEVHNGADDNASGTATAIELARLLVESVEPPSCDVLIALWSAAERDAMGSQHWIESEARRAAEIVCSLNLDRVGRSWGEALEVRGVESAELFDGMLDSASRICRLALERCATSAMQIGTGEHDGADFETFLGHGIPALWFSSGEHADVRRPSDDAARIDSAGAAQVAEFLMVLIEQIGDGSGLEYVDEMDLIPNRAWAK